METSTRFLIYVKHPVKGLIQSVFIKRRFLTVDEAKASIVKFESAYPGTPLLPMKVVKTTMTFEIIED